MASSSPIGAVSKNLVPPLLDSLDNRKTRVHQNFRFRCTPYLQHRAEGDRFTSISMD